MIDGAKTTITGNSAVPLRGVKQGCPLSPLSRPIVGSVEEYIGGQRLYAFMVRHAQVWFRTPTVQIGFARQCGCTIL